jgi:hypothetical protein
MLGGLAVCTLQDTAVLGGGRCYVVRGLFQPDLWIGINCTMAGPQIYMQQRIGKVLWILLFSFVLHVRLLLPMAIDGRIIDSMIWFLL